MVGCPDSWLVLEFAAAPDAPLVVLAVLVAAVLVAAVLVAAALVLVLAVPEVTGAPPPMVCDDVRWLAQPALASSTTAEAANHHLFFISHPSTVIGTCAGTAGTAVQGLPEDTAHVPRALSN